MTTNLKDRGDNWITGTVDGLHVQAKCYTEPSHYGMDEEGRISKLWIKDAASGKVLYNYDRGYDFDGINADSLRMVVAAVAKKIK
jgi:hypothetical protein